MSLEGRMGSEVFGRGVDVRRAKIYVEDGEERRRHHQEECKIYARKRKSGREH